LVHFLQSKLDSQPSSIVPVLKSLGWVVVTFAGFQASNFVPITYIFTSEYLEHTLLGSALLYRLVFQFWAVTFSRFKYYFVWNLAETACIASGLGFNGIDEKTGAAKWDRVNNIDFVQVETAGTMKELTSGWNRRINHWLTYYIYTRVSTNKTLANVCTKFTSAFWHGFYPGYYQLFLSAVFVQFADDTYHRIFRRFFYRDDEVKDEKTGKTKVVSVPLLPAPLRFFYHFFAFLEVHFMLNYFALAFVLLEIQKGLDAWSTISYAGHFVTFSIIALGFLVPKRRSKRAAAAAAAVTADSNAAAATPAASSAAAAAAPVDAAIPAADEARVTSPARRGRSSRAD
jgi:lysophospholipid acyltransferase